MSHKGVITVHKWTNKMPYLALRDLIENRDKWHNTHSTLCGWPVGPKDLLHWDQLSENGHLTIQQRSAMLWGQPDYVVYSCGIPILFHLTTPHDEMWYYPETAVGTKPNQSHIQLMKFFTPMLNNMAAEENMAWSD